MSASRLVRIITSSDDALRHSALDDVAAELSRDELLAECKALEEFRRASSNLYERVRAVFFLESIHRYHLPARPGVAAAGHIPYDGFEHLLVRRFETAVERFLEVQRESGPSDTISSALAAAYHGIGFQTLADQVKKSVRAARGNAWMFRIGHPGDQPLRIRPELLDRGRNAWYPLLRERTPVRMDLSHSGWSDIFFLGMDFPEGARVLNISVDLAVRDRDAQPQPPIETFLRVIDEPVLRLTSVDLGATADITELDEVFDFARDYLGLLKAAVIAAGIVPPGLEGSGENLSAVLEELCGRGRGLEIASWVRGIPKGSRLAVSTNLLASLIAVCMRATSQASSLTGVLTEGERRTVAARAILGEWLGGSGGGWQDSGGVWPGAKLIRGQLAEAGDPEFGVSRGRLLPGHELLEATDDFLERLQESVVLVHGGMAQNVGPVLEMVTEKYLLRSADEWRCRLDAVDRLDRIVAAVRDADVKRLARLTTENFFGPIEGIIPWATNAFTETVIRRVADRFGEDYWGFLMLGGMSGGGMGFWFAPRVQTEAKVALQEILSATRLEMQHSLPFAMEPVVYEFAINTRGTCAELSVGDDAMLPSQYYQLLLPELIRSGGRDLPVSRQRELERLSRVLRVDTDHRDLMPAVFDRLLPLPIDASEAGESLDDLLRRCGFDRKLHERIRSDLRAGRIGLAQNRLPQSVLFEDVLPVDVEDTLEGISVEARMLGERALEAGEVAVVTLAAGAASRWTQGAGVVKALHPFCKLGGDHRSFLEVHLGKSRRTATRFGCSLPHVFTTSLFTHSPIARHLDEKEGYGHTGPLHLSEGRSVGLRLVPTARDLVHAYEEIPHQQLDEQAQKVRESLEQAYIDWARRIGEASDYTDNVPLSCLHPVGHWFEMPNMLRNGVLLRLLEERPQLRWLMIHNIDTLGANVDPGLLGLHIARGACLSFEVIPRRIDDLGGGLARIDGRPRLVEGLAMPREELEFELSYYNSATTWIDLDRLLSVFGLERGSLGDSRLVEDAVHRISLRLPTYVTLKDVKKRWGHGQEDVFPVTQFEKLWGDMSSLPEVESAFFVVPRLRGQQLKDPAQLDAWVRDGSRDHVESLVEWE